MDLKKHIRQVPDFPKKGINFIDITTLCKDPQAFKYSIDSLAKEYAGQNIHKVVGPESRGFITGAPVAYLLNAGFIPVRKKGKLPAKTVSRSYALEYGEAEIEIHEDAIQPGENVLVIDDLLATGGTVKAILELLKELGANIIGCGFLVELEFLQGRTGINVPIFSLVKY